MGMISKIKDKLLDKIDLGNSGIFKFPLVKTGKLLNDYVRGEFVVISGRKTSGKRSFIFKNYVLHPIMEKLTYKQDLDVRVFYFSTKKTADEIVEKIATSYIAQKTATKKGDKAYNKLSVSSFYNYSGADIKLDATSAKTNIVNAFKVIDAFVEKNYLKVIGGTKSIFEIKNIIKSIFGSYGFFDEDFDEFTYKEEFTEMIPIIIIDDASMVLGEDGRNCIKNDNSARLGIALKDLAKTLNAIVVLNVPSGNTYVSQKESFYINKIEEIGPYSNLADKILFMHNPKETGDRYSFDYEMADFTNLNNGVCYFRHMTIAANTLGPSGITIPYFLFPQSGNIFELPGIDSDKLNEYKELVYNKDTDKSKPKKDGVESLDND